MQAVGRASSANLLLGEARLYHATTTTRTRSLVKLEAKDGGKLQAAAVAARTTRHTDPRVEAVDLRSGSGRTAIPPLPRARKRVARVLGKPLSRSSHLQTSHATARPALNDVGLARHLTGNVQDLDSSKKVVRAFDASLIRGHQYDCKFAHEDD
jgi:hypothetical protein